MSYIMKRVLAVVAVLLAACGGYEADPVPALTASGTAEIGVALPDGGFVDGGWADPCSLVNGRNHHPVTYTVTAIDNADPKCPVGRYQALGEVSVGSLPIEDNRLGPCPIVYSPGSRQIADGGYEPTCRTTAACTMQSNGGDSAIRYDLTWNVRGELQGWWDQTSSGQLCPYVRVTLSNWSTP